MKQILHLLNAVLLLNSVVHAQHIGINTNSPDRPITIKAAGTNQELISLRDTLDNTKWHLNMPGDGLSFVQSGVADHRLFLAANGGVGIGTNLPYAILDVRNQLFPLMANFAGPVGYTKIHITDNADTAQIGVDAAGMFLGTFDNADVRIRAGDINRIYLTAATGNTGIGQSNPSFKLDVLENKSTNPTVAGFTATGATGEIKVSNNNSTVLLGTDDFGGYAGSANNVDFRLTSGGHTRLMVKNGSGNVAIGDIHADHKLDVIDFTPNSTVARFASNGGYGQIHVTNFHRTAQMGIDNNGMFVGSLDSADFRIRTNATNRLVIKDITGNVGIGQFSPLNKLDVEGAVAIGGAFSGNQTAPANGLIVQGNVGIGNGAPAEKLVINGAIKVADGGYSILINNALAPVPAGGSGTIVFTNGHFYGWTGTVWKQLDN